MLDHIIITVSDLERSGAFYTTALKHLDIKLSMDFKGQDGHPDLKGFGKDNSIFFWLKEGKSDSNGVHIGFVAKDHADVETFHKAALAAGAKSLYAPRVFPEYYPGYFATWIIDPDGYEIELVHKG
ncbi:VOC family protein [Chryseobacterium sp. PBS4-4]|uniref:VOC family protein n=1 Tax=Chryseobacterium edaphi TaxID=2976532 RepID=A0ABT2W351_9FLAO|nr:VOC family protein [Chryseobacterium edaphi]MCU7616638.1 VOC family protein [Chryseobacterium edaphi]